MTTQELLTRINNGEFPCGRCVNGEWKWEMNGKSVTRAINNLRKSGKINIVYHYKFASVSNLTP